MLKAIVIGNLGGDPETRYSADGRPLLRMNVAANYRNRSPEGEWQDKTEWIRVTVLGQRAEVLGQHLRKGSKIYAEGRLEARPWTDRQGQVRAGLELVAYEVEFMSSRPDDETRAGGQPVGAGSRAVSDVGQAQDPRPDDAELGELPF
jgi:single-strand DNA-binding protein